MLLDTLFAFNKSVKQLEKWLTNSHPNTKLITTKVKLYLLHWNIEFICLSCTYLHLKRTCLLIMMLKLYKLSTNNMLGPTNKPTPEDGSQKWKCKKKIKIVNGQLMIWCETTIFNKNCLELFSLSLDSVCLLLLL